MFGRFLELAIATADIAASVQFYERLGFVQVPTNDAWSHRYGVLTDGRIHIGLHEHDMPSPSICFVLQELVQARARLTAARFEPELARLGEDELHQLRLRDPSGFAILLLEARTYSPAAPPPSGESICGYFSHLSMPERDFGAAREFWERAGFVALEQVDEPYAHMPLTSDRLDLAFHAPRLFDAPLLVFECGDWTQQRARLDAAGVALSPELPRGQDRGRCGLIEAPEGTLLWMIGAA
jgi:catechol 2,3-dioxygenase-like lactoylglutathione lyase family enzyme